MREVPKFLKFSPAITHNAPFEGMVNRSGKNPDPEIDPGKEFTAIMAQVGKKAAGLDGVSANRINPEETGAPIQVPSIHVPGNVRGGPAPVP